MKKNIIIFLIGMGIILIGVVVKTLHFNTIYIPLLILGLGIEIFSIINIIKYSIKS